MNRQEFIKIAIKNFGLTKEEAKAKADIKKIIEQDRKEAGIDELYTYDDLFDDEFGENKLEQDMDDECEQWLYDSGYYD